MRERNKKESMCDHLYAVVLFVLLDCFDMSFNA